MNKNPLQDAYFKMIISKKKKIYINYNYIISSSNISYFQFT
uniref:Uncharacterized protein n=1 Tax=Lepeophtheirus salmonis TaxID=72036 RepID=A0A0K2V3Z3_LEPSM